MFRSLLLHPDSFVNSQSSEVFYFFINLSFITQSLQTELSSLILELEKPFPSGGWLGLATHTTKNLQSVQHKNVKNGETDTDEETLMAYWGILN